MSELLGRGPDERLAFVYLAVGSVLGFVAQLPALVRRARRPDAEFEAAIRAETPATGLAVPADIADAKFEALVAGALMGWIFLVPPILYLVALASHWLARPLGGQGTGLRARVALFWSVLAAMPALLLSGLTAGFVGPGPAATATGILTLCVFLWVWLNSLYVAETPHA